MIFRKNFDGRKGSKEIKIVGIVKIASRKVVSDLEGKTTELAVVNTSQRKVKER